jgi:HEAT repeat protein
LREHAVGVCESIEDLPSGSAEAIAKLLSTAKNDSAYWCATLLGRMGSDAAIAVPALINCLQHQTSVAIRERAAWTLGKIGSDAVSAIGSLKEAAKSSDQRLSRVAQEAIDLIS